MSIIDGSGHVALRDSWEANKAAYLKMFDLTNNQQELVIRESSVKESLNYLLKINPIIPFMAFKNRKYDINYFRKEMIWKLTGDKFNDSILSAASMWKSVQNTDGSFNSNYGQYWFGEQMGLYKAFNEIVADINTRRATIPMLKASHIGHGVKDSVCTGHITFHVRDHKLHCTVSMRSSDQIHGLGTDIPSFAFLQRLMWGMLNDVDICCGLGPLSIFADSSHFYKRHYAMVENILRDSSSPYFDSNPSAYFMPCPTDGEAFKLIAKRGVIDANDGPLSAWLLENQDGF